MGRGVGVVLSEGSQAVSLVHCRQLNHKKEMCLFMRLVFCSSKEGAWQHAFEMHLQKKL